MTTIRPSDFIISDNPITQALIGTLGRAELEFCAALIIRWHHARGAQDWEAVSREDIAKLFGSDPIAGAWARCPFFRPDPFAFARGGFITEWLDGDASSKGELTPKFFEAVSREWERRERLGLARQ